ncbi:MAG: hypothetical protein JWO71_701 [Candidatus Acidoferrum typicum]|nr:hypothetical protein [Candidatus Acidoferrum typicum]
MANLGGKAVYQKALTRILAWGALVVCATSSPALAQNSIAGHFTLKENARFGSSVLAAGPYKFSIEPIGTIQSVRSIQGGASHLVLVVMTPEKSGPAASTFAMASPSNHTSDASELTLDPERAGTLVHTMYLEKEGLLVDFLWSSPKATEKVIAQQAVPVQTADAMLRRN